MPISSASTSNLEERFQHVTVDQASSDSAQLICGVPQGSALSSVLFSTYTVQMGKIIEQYGIDRKLFVDDTSFYDTFYLDQEADLMAIQNLQIWCCEVKAWMFWENRKLSDAERLKRCSVDQRPSGQKYQCSLFVLERVRTHAPAPSGTREDWGLFLRSGITIHDHVHTTVKGCHYHFNFVWKL